ncbi:retrotransposon protein, putative, unclassified [Tanacetum coccineum]
MADKSVKVGKHSNVALDSNSTTRTQTDVNAGLEFPIVYKAHGIHSPTSANEKNINDVGTTVKPMSLYANVTGEPSRKALNFHTLFTPGGNGVDVVVPVESIRAISERFVNIAYDFFLGKRVAYPVVANYVRNTWSKYGLVKPMFSSSTGLFSFQFSSIDGLNAMLENGSWFIRKHPLILKKWKPDVNLLKEDVGNVSVWVKLHGVPVTAFSEDGKSSYARAMIELQADVELKDTIMVAMPKLTEERFYTCTVRVEYEWKPSRGVLVGQKVGFKPVKQVYQSVSRKPTANTSGPKKKNMKPTKEANSSGSSFWNVNSPSTNPIIEKIDKIKKIIIDGKVILVDDEGKPLEKVECLGDYDSEDEVASVDNEMFSFFARKDGNA